MCFPGVDRVIGRKGAPLSSPPESFPLQYVNDDDETKLKLERGMCSGHYLALLYCLMVQTIYSYFQLPTSQLSFSKGKEIEMRERRRGEKYLPRV
jgi:hypothetical protein